MRTIEAIIEPDGTVRLLEPLELSEAHRALVTVLEGPLERPPLRYLGAFASGHRDTSARTDEVLGELGFPDR